MTRNDTGIDCCDLENTIVQCKLRKNGTLLNWKDCSTFFGSQNIYDKELGKYIIKWENLIITRNKECSLSENLLFRYFVDKTYCRENIIYFCENLLLNPPQYPIFNDDSFKLRDYQNECIDLIKQSNKNVIISLPTGSGKNVVIIYSMKPNCKYLILVPRIILMDQLKKEIIKHNPKMKSKIQLIGDKNTDFKEDKNITICVFNSVSIVADYGTSFDKIFIDEAHHINKPMIYCNDDSLDFNESIDDSSEGSVDGLSEESVEDLSDYESDEDSSEGCVDDTEDELVNGTNYTQIIKSLEKYNNNVYLSATIDEKKGFEYYNKDIREMIDLKYLCDYEIHVPIFSEDPTNKNICFYLLNNYRNIIIYCNTQKEGKLINKLFNDIQNFSSEYIDCKTPKNKRDNIIERYKKGEIPFLVNVRILVEGFDAPITRGVCFLHMPQSKTTLIQIIGRALRLHPLKTIANIILPYSCSDDEKNICKFLKIMANNDSRIKKSFESKRLGGYISIDNTYNEEDYDDEDVINEEIEFKYYAVYNSLGVLQNGEDKWIKRLNDVKKYIDENCKKPSFTDKNKDIKQLCIWINHQIINYKSKKDNMTNELIYSKWTEFINEYKDTLNNADVAIVYFSKTTLECKKMDKIELNDINHILARQMAVPRKAPLKMFLPAFLNFLPKSFYS